MCLLSFLWKTNKTPKTLQTNPLNQRLPLSRPSPSRPPAPHGRIRDVSHCGDCHRCDASRHFLTGVQLFVRMYVVGPPRLEMIFKVSMGQVAVFINREGGVFASSYSRVLWRATASPRSDAAPAPQAPRHPRCRAAETPPPAAPPPPQRFPARRRWGARRAGRAEAGLRGPT